MDKWIYGYDRARSRFNHLHLRNYYKSDFEDLIQIQKKAFPPPFPPELWWNKEQLANHLEIFPQGCICIEVDGVVAGSMTTMRTDMTNEVIDHTWDSMTGEGTMSTHNPEGNTLYVVDLCVDPDYRSLGLGRQLTQAMYENVVHLNLERLVGGARMPLYHKYHQELTPEEYVNLVIGAEIKDPVITFLLKSGRSPIKPMADYIMDEESCHYGLLTEWRNPFFS